MAPPSSSQRCCESLLDSSTACEFTVTIQWFEMKRQYQDGVPLPMLLFRTVIVVRSRAPASLKGARLDALLQSQLQRTFPGAVVVLARVRRAICA